MTNREYMFTLNTMKLEIVMHELYFNPKLWMEGDQVKQHSTPNMFEVCAWLNDRYDSSSKFWQCIEW